MAGHVTIIDVERAHRHLRIASTLCYVQCVFMALSTIALGVPTFAKGPRSALAYYLLAGFIAMSVAFGIAGRLLRKYRRSGAWIALGIIVVEILLRMSMHASLLNLWLALDAVIVILIASGWRHLELRPQSAQPSAT
jgi:uncharacterized membrane protein